MSTPAVVQSPVAQAITAFIAFVVATALLFGVSVDPEVVALYTPALIAAATFIYSRVRKVPVDDRGLRSSEDNAPHLDRLIADLEAEVPHD